MRESGILMPVSSLPGPYGIGCFGKKAEKFVDFLAAAGQKIWQILPLSPTGYGDSPYQSCSAFAGNPYFIDLDALKAEGLLTAAQLKAEPWGKDPLNVDYGTLYTSRYKILRAAYAAWRRQCAGQHGCAHYYPDAYYAFTLENEGWLEDYALYMALKTANGMKSWTQWPREYRKREPQALEAFKAENEEEIGFWKFLQYEFSIQWKKLKAYANANNVQILGDIPIYVSADSVDAWVGGPLFELDADGGFARVAGCPPDYFSAEGQLWGNPLYNWPYHKQTGYAWWIQRVRHALGIYDLLRIDHFRGFDTYWAIPADSTTAKTGKWETGPRMELFNALEGALGKLPIIAEDLGELFPSVRELLADSTFPGMKVLQFAFGGGDSEYLPHNHVKNSVVYPGTHDNTDRLVGRKRIGQGEGCGRRLPASDRLSAHRKGGGRCQNRGGPHRAAPGCAGLCGRPCHHPHGRLAGPGRGSPPEQPRQAGRKLELARRRWVRHCRAGQAHSGGVRRVLPYITGPETRSVFSSLTKM